MPKSTTNQAGLTAKQERFIESLLVLQNITQAATAAGVSKRTALYWMHGTGTPVSREYERRRLEQAEKFRERLNSLHEKAFGALEAMLDDGTQPEVRFRAVKLVYEGIAGKPRALKAPAKLVYETVERVYDSSMRSSNVTRLIAPDGSERITDVNIEWEDPD